MTTSDHQQTEAVQSAADEKWVLLQDDSDAAEEVLLEEQDGNARGEEESIPNAGEGQKDAQDTRRFFWWFRWAWNEVFVNSALSDDMRPYCVIAALSVHAVLKVLAALASLAQWSTLHALFICLEHFTAATLIAAVLSFTARFVSMTVVEASTLKKLNLHSALSDMRLSIVLIIPAACFACIYNIGTGITVFQKARREEDFGWFLQLLADMARVHVLTAAIVLSASLVFLMGTDVVTTHRAIVLHNRMMAEYRKPAARRSPALRAHPKPSLLLKVMVSFLACGVITVIFLHNLLPLCAATFAHLEHAYFAARGGI